MKDYRKSQYNYRKRQTKFHRRKMQGRKTPYMALYYITITLLVLGNIAYTYVRTQEKQAITTSPLARTNNKPLPNTTFLLTTKFSGLLPKPAFAASKPDVVDYRIAKLRNFFESKHSPLANEAEQFVKVADENGLDYTLMPSITCIESACGIQLPAGSYNPFGLGGSNFMWFSSFDEAIQYEANLLSQDYRGNMIAAIQAKYCPASDNCNPEWGDVVTEAQEEIINN